MERVGPYLLGGAVSGALIGGIVAAFLSIAALVGQTVLPTGTGLSPTGSGTVNVGGIENAPDSASEPAGAAGPAGPLSARAQAGPTENRLGRSGLSHFPDVDPVWHYGFLFSPALTIGGGTFAIQRNIVAEHVLGLPRDIDVERGLTWSQSRQRGR